jgi:hypothetical protein
MFRTAALLLMAYPAFAQVDPTAPLPTLTCIPHGDLATAMKASGAVIYGIGLAQPDGRKLEFYVTPQGQWTGVVVWRPNGSVTKTSCSQIFAIGDPGAFIPSK